MNISLDITLARERLKLRPVAPADVDLVWGASRYLGFTDGMTWDPPATRDEILDMNRQIISNWALGKGYVFTIELIKGVQLWPSLSAVSPSRKRRRREPGISGSGFIQIIGAKAMHLKLHAQCWTLHGMC